MKATLIFSLAALLAVKSGAEPVGKFPSVEERMLARAERLPIPQVEFKDITLAEALDILRTEVRVNDPTHRGIPIEVHVEPWALGGSFKPDAPPPAGWPIYDPMKQRITLSLRNTSLAKALHDVSNFVGCRIVPSRTALVIAPPITDVDPVFTHTIPIAAAPKSERDKMHTDPVGYFRAFGVPFLDSRSSFHFEGNGSTLVVTNTQESLDLIDLVLESSVTRLRPK